MKLTRTVALACLFGLTPLAVAQAQSGASPTSGRSFAATLPGQPAVTTALDGYCAVCAVMDKGWVKGDPNIASVVDGKRYLFPSADVKALFDANPAKFVPAAGGDCVVCQVEKSHKVAGSVQFAAKHEGRLFLFPDEKAKQVFVANPAKYATADLAYGGDCAVCQVNMGKRMPGNADHTAVYKGKRYLFPSDTERQAFLADPARYAERQGG